MGPHRIAVVVPQGFAVFELGIAIEVFAIHRAGLPEPWYDVKLCAVEAGPVSTQCGVLSMHIPFGIEAIDEADTVIIPEAGQACCPPHDVPGATAPPPQILAAIRRAYARGARLVSFCDGAFVLAAAGILDGRPATTHWKHAAQLAREHPRIDVRPDVLYVDDGQVLTSAGTSAGVDLSMHIVRQDHGAGAARTVARHLVMPPHREGGQAQYIMTPMPEPGTAANGIQRVLDHVAHHLDQDLNLSDMAALAYMSTRNFTRRFREVTGTTPAQWVLQRRLTRARELLEETDEGIERIALLAGFGSAVTMRQRFVSVLGTSPSSYRRSFRDLRADEPQDPDVLGRPALAS